MGNIRHFHKGIGPANQGAGAFGFIELSFATQGYA